MILTYGSYTITGTAQELKEFIDLIEGKNYRCNISNHLNENDLSLRDDTVIAEGIKDYLKKHSKQDLYTGIKCEKCDNQYFILAGYEKGTHFACINCDYVFQIPNDCIPKKVGTVQISEGTINITTSDEAD